MFTKEQGRCGSSIGKNHFVKRHYDQIYPELKVGDQLTKRQEFITQQDMTGASNLKPWARRSFLYIKKNHESQWVLQIPTKRTKGKAPCNGLYNIIGLQSLQIFHSKDL